MSSIPFELSCGSWDRNDQRFIGQLCDIELMPKDQVQYSRKCLKRHEEAYLLVALSIS